MARFVNAWHPRRDDDVDPLETAVKQQRGSFPGQRGQKWGLDPNTHWLPPLVVVYYTVRFRMDDSIVDGGSSQSQQQAPCFLPHHGSMANPVSACSGTKSILDSRTRVVDSVAGDNDISDLAHGDTTMQRLPVREWAAVGRLLFPSPAGCRISTYKS